MTRLLILLVACYVASCLADEVTIEGLGTVSGTTTKSSRTERTIYEYRGIPYAEPPTVDNRFKYPMKKAPFTATFDATEFAPMCTQFGTEEPTNLRAYTADTYQPGQSVIDSMLRRTPGLKVTGKIIGTEDCLTLDVHTPTKNSSARLPVMVYLHGGTYVSGSSSALRPGYLLEKDIVLVVPQYRLGPFGFMFLNDEVAPGNMGLADQEMALIWVRDNIEAFGGDPSLITVAGNSAGASSASLHMINNQTEEVHRLFDRVIALSGSALSMWAVDTTNGEKRSREVAAEAGCTGELATDVAECMRGKSAEEIITVFVEYQTQQIKNGIWAAGASIPVVQSSPEATYAKYIPYRPQDVLEKGTYLALPMMVGSTEHEGIYALDLAYEGYLVPNNVLNDTVFLRDELIKVVLNAYGVDENSGVMADACARRYFENADLGDFEKMMPGLIDFLGVAFFKGSVFRQAELHSLKEKVYMYSFEYFGQHSTRKPGANSVEISGGVTHTNDILYIFPYEDMQISRSLDVTVSKRMVHMLTNFVIHGDPTPMDMENEGFPEFISYSRADANYMKVEDTMEMKRRIRETFTTARENGLLPPKYNSGSALFSSAVLLLIALATSLFNTL